MAHNKQTQDQCRAKYVQGLPLASAAEACGVAYPTARNWKRKAKLAGDDWDIARAAKRMSNGNIEELTGQVLEQLTEQFLTTLDEIKINKKLDTVAKTEMLARLSDSYIKTLAAVGRANPKLSRLTVGMDVLKELAGFVAEHHPKQREWFIGLIEAFGPVMSHRFS